MTRTALGPGLALAVALGLTGAACAETIVIRAAAYVDVDAGKLVAPAILVIEDGEIADVNPIKAPRADRTIDLGTMTLVPGLVDTHTHLTMDLSRGHEMDSTVATPADFALLAAFNARKTLLAGFTTVRDLGAYGFADVAIGRAIDQGIAVGPDIIPSGHAVGITGGHCDITGLGPGVLETGPEKGIGDGPDELVKAIRYQIKHGAEVVKICATSGVLSNEATAGAQQTSLEELKAAVEEAHRHEVRIAAHAVGTDGIIAAAVAGVDSIEHASMLNADAVDAIKANDTYVVPTLYLLNAVDPSSLPPAMRKKGEAVRAAAFQSFRLALENGVKIAFGTDAGVFAHGDNAKELTTRVDLGQDPAEAIRSATIYAVDLLGLKDRGRIRAGYRADLIAVEGNPLADIRTLEHVKFVMQKGVEVRQVALQR